MASILKVSQLQKPDGSTPTAADLGLDVSGNILQVVGVTKTDTFDSTSTNWVDCTGLSVTITPKSATSKFLITGNINMGWDQGAAKVAARVTRNGTGIAIGDTNGFRERTTGYLYIDSINYSPFAIPVSHIDEFSSASPITYKWQVQKLDTGGNLSVNKSYDVWGDSIIYGTTVSSLTVYEIAQ